MTPTEHALFYVLVIGLPGAVLIFRIIRAALYVFADCHQERRQREFEAEQIAAGALTPAQAADLQDFKERVKRADR